MYTNVQMTKLAEVLGASVSTGGEAEAAITAAGLMAFVAERCPAVDERWTPLLLATLGSPTATIAQVNQSMAGCTVRVQTLSR